MAKKGAKNKKKTHSQGSVNSKTLCYLQAADIPVAGMVDTTDPVPAPVPAPDPEPVSEPIPEAEDVAEGSTVEEHNIRRLIDSSCTYGHPLLRSTWLQTSKVG
jgi:hypothetical protein